MSSYSVVLPVLLAACVVLPMSGCTTATGQGPAEAMTIYVALDGNNGWTGSLAQPNADGTDGPLATFEAARDAIRKLKAGGELKTPVRVLARGGRYFLDQTLVLTPDDSGTADSPITYGAYPGERVVVSGGRPVTGWKEMSAQGDLPKRWVASLPEVAAGRWSFTQLFVGDRRADRARLPAEGFYKFDEYPAMSVRGSKVAKFREGDVKQWADWEDVEFVVLDVWKDHHMYLESVDWDQRILHFITPASQEIGGGGQYFILNAKESLRQMGQWYLDRKAGELSYIPNRREQINQIDIVAPRLKEVLRLEGGQVGFEGRRVQHVRFEHLEFQHTEWSLPKDVPGPVQGSWYVPGAIVLRGAEQCTFFDCSVSHVAGFGVDVQRGCWRNAFVGCHFFDMGAGGIRVGMERHRNYADLVSLNKEEMGFGELADTPDPVLDVDLPRGKTTLIENCHIHDGGKVFFGGPGVLIQDSGHNVVRHNWIHHMPYTGVSVGWEWGYAPTFTNGNIVEYNHIHHIGLDLMSDLGGIYTLGRQPGAIIRNNYIHNVTGGHGTYTDAGSSFMLWENNVSTNCDNGHLHHYGRDNIFRNCLWAQNKSNGMMQFRDQPFLGYVVERSIISDVGNEVIGWIPLEMTRFRDNCYWPGRRTGSWPFQSVSFADWMTWGQDSGSIVADPLLRGAEGNQADVRANSPALAKGFVPIDVSQSGIKWENGTAPAGVDQVRLNWPEPVPVIIPLLLPDQRLGSLAQMLWVKNKYAPYAIYFDDNQPQAMTLRLRNYGLARGAGTFQLSLAEATNGRLDGQLSVSYDLESNEIADYPFTLTPSAAAGNVVVEVTSDSDGAVSSAIMLKRQPRWDMAALPKVQSIEQAKAVLADVAPRPVGERGIPMGQVRLAVAGDDLLIRADVIDTIVRWGSRPGAGSAVILLVDKGRGDPKRYNLRPQGTKPEQVPDVTTGGSGETAPQLAAQVKLDYVRTEQGWTLQAIVPLAALELDPAATQLSLEVLFSTTARPGDSYRMGPMADSASPFDNNTGFCKVNISR